MVNPIRQSNQNVLNNPNIDDSWGGDMFWYLGQSSPYFPMMIRDINRDASIVEDSVQGFTNTREEPTSTAEVTDSFDDQLIASNTVSSQPITGLEMISTTSSLSFSDYETGRLESSDQTDEGRYIDNYSLTSLAEKETITLDLKTSGFSSVLQLIDGNTGNIINSIESLQSDGTSESQMVFTSDSSIEYLVRVTSTGEVTTGDYTLGTSVGELNPELIITDRETGVLEVGDDTYQGRYKDEYVLRGFQDNEDVIIDLETLGFDGFLQVLDRNTGEIINQYEVNPTDETFDSQLSFTTDANIDYLVRVTSTGETSKGSYTLETTIGELILGVSDQIIQGTLSNTDKESNAWRGRYSDVYEVTETSDNQTLNIELTSFEYSTIIILINADTGRYLTSNIDFSPNEDGSYTSNISRSVDGDINYGVIVSSYQGYQTGDYTLSINTTSSVSGGFDSTDDDYHPIIRSLLMDNYMLSNLQTGEDVSLKISSDSSNIIQLFNQETGDVLQNTTSSHLNFTVEEDITYGVRVLGQEGQNYSLLTDTGILFDSTVVEWDQPLTASLVTSDTLNMFARNNISSSYYADGYYVSGDDLVVGDILKIQAESTEFAPYLYMVNAETGELIKKWGGSRKKKTVNFAVEEEMDYLIIVSSLYRNTVGEYTFNLNIH